MGIYDADSDANNVRVEVVLEGQPLLSFQARQVICCAA
jgi:hypothetical protein